MPGYIAVDPEQPSVKSFMAHVQNSKKSFLPGLPSVHINAVCKRSDHWCPVHIKEGIIVLAENECRRGQILKVFLIVFIPTPRAEQVQLSSVSVKERDCNLAVENVFSDITDPED